MGDLQIGDYAFIKLQNETKPASVKRLWKLNRIQGNDGEFVASFDEICQFDPVPLLKFEALDLFVLDMNLLNKCNKQTKGLSFYNLSLINEKKFKELTSSSEELCKYLADENHYRKFTKAERKKDVASKTIDVQFYKKKVTHGF